MSKMFFKKALCKVKASGLQLGFTKFSIAFNLACNKNELYKTLGLLIQRYT